MSAAISMSMVMTMLMCVVICMVATGVRMFMVMVAVLMPVSEVFFQVLCFFTDKSERVVLAARAQHQRITAHSLLHKSILRDALHLLLL